MPIDASTWVAVAPLATVVREFPAEDECLVFVEWSGDLHLVSSAAASALRRLIEAPATLNQLALAEATTAAALEPIVATLDALGLVAPVAW